MQLEFKVLNKDLVYKSAPKAFGINCANEVQQRQNVGPKKIFSPFLLCSLSQKALPALLLPADFEIENGRQPGISFRQRGVLIKAWRLL